MWEKFIFLTALSGVAAVTRMTAGVVRSLPGTRQMLMDAMHETAAVARTNNVAIDDEVIARTLAIIDALPEAATPSMQRDILAGRPSELEAQNGAVVRLGAAAGIATPAHAFIYYALLPQEQQARAATER